MKCEEFACSATEQVIDIELSERSPPELAGAYHALCAMLLIRTALAMGKTANALRCRKGEIAQKVAAERWIEGGRGVLSFREVCEAFDMDPDTAKRRIRDHAASELGGSINRRKRPRTHLVFGRTCDACRRRPVSGRKTQTAC